MKFFQTFDIAASGMRANQFQMDLISENIANAHTTKTKDGTPYRRKEAIVTAQQKEDWDSEMGASFDDKAFEIDKKGVGTAQFDGGGVMATVAESKDDFKWVYDPTNPDAQKSGEHAGYVAQPNVNIIVEMTKMMEATRAYEANSTMVESAKSIAMKALEIGKG